MFLSPTRAVPRNLLGTGHYNAHLSKEQGARHKSSNREVTIMHPFEWRPCTRFAVSVKNCSYSFPQAKLLTPTLIGLSERSPVV
jgi:hypothetical protein